MTTLTPNGYANLAGPDKAALLMLAVGEDNAAMMFEMMDEDEVADISRAMARLGTVRAEVVDRLLAEFARRFDGTGPISGTVESTERLLVKTLGAERASEIMESVRGPAGRTVWHKLSKVSAERLAGYLRAEHPQTVAVVLSRVKAETAAGVLSQLPEGFADEVVQRLLRLEAPRKDIVEDLERTLEQEFMGRMAGQVTRDAHAHMARMLSALDGRNAERLLDQLEARAAGEAERVRKLMFTFEDLARIGGESMRRLLPEIDKRCLAVALKGADRSVREVFLSAMSERARRLMLEDIAALGPVRLREVDAAREEIVARAKELSRSGAIALGDEEMVA